jgi:hypothetical protein
VRTSAWIRAMRCSCVPLSRGSNPARRTGNLPQGGPACVVRRMDARAGSSRLWR